MKTAILYLRTLRDEVGRETSLPAQRLACARYAQEQGFVVIDEYLDVGSRRGAEALPGLGALSGRLEAHGDVSHLIVLDRARLDRDVLRLHELEQRLNQAGVRLTFVRRCEQSPADPPPESSRAVLGDSFEAADRPDDRPIRPRPDVPVDRPPGSIARLMRQTLRLLDSRQTSSTGRRRPHEGPREKRSE